MQSLTLPLSASEIQQVGDELEKLFLFQDRPFGSDKRILFTQEIAKLGYPFPSVINGIRSLLLEDLKAIKITYLVQAIKDAAREIIDQKMADKDVELEALREREWRRLHGEKI